MSSIKSSKWKIALLIAVTAMIVLGVIGTTTYLKENPVKWQSYREREKDKIASETLEYMKKNYNEEFEIDSIKYIPQNKSYAIMVHSKSDPDLNVRVLKWAMGGYELTDDYISTKRFRQTTKYFRHFANDISDRNLFQANIIGGKVYDTKLYWDTKYTIKELLEKDAKNTELNFLMFFFFDITEENVDEVCKKLYNMVKYMQEADIGEVEMEVLFFSEEYFKNKDVEKINREEMGPLGMMNFDSIYGGEYALTRISIFNKMHRYKDIKTYRDIKSYKDIKRIMRYKKFKGTVNLATGRRDFEWIGK